MPIDYKIYPPNWKEIRARIIARANNCCEGSPKYPTCRAQNHKPHPITKAKVILTIAHINHDPENWEVKDEELKAWCQRCHFGYDRKRHINKRKFGIKFYKQPVFSFPVEGHNMSA
jgi:hypothetical protein